MMEIKKKWVLIPLLMTLICFDLSHGVVKQDFHVNPVQPVKTVQVGKEDIFDCIDIYKQPSLNHPLLKEHKIQMKPTSLPRVTLEEGLSESSRDAEITNIGCPLGTVPIRRGNTQDIKAHSHEFLRYRTHAIGNLQNDNEYFAAHQSNKGQFKGAKMSLSIHAIDGVKPTQESGAMLLLTDRQQEPNFNDQLYAGWLISNELYHDYQPRLTIYRTSAKDGKGCVNIRCPGFVQTSHNFPVGAPFSNVSKLHGIQYSVTVLIYIDPNTHNWWFLYGEHLRPLGYWPSALFTTLSRFAPAVIATGMATSKHNDTGPPMGTGRFPIEGFGLAAYIRSIEIVKNVTSDSIFLADGQPYFLLSVATESCYDPGQLEHNDKWGLYFFYGGPGGCHCVYFC